ncbi:hypothetical protein DBV05_g10702 [Lasiodiplodia theobromae]|uniref:Uncharacterized protein n=1 Tax=Lasiodiplodia theobromae TaxID=45133 RepID=A0A5N5CZ55_9PEZI|nr:hypothetical protein DBV05_g10702 [Lasiodiplodia theobromae]
MERRSAAEKNIGGADEGSLSGVSKPHPSSEEPPPNSDDEDEWIIQIWQDRSSQGKKEKKCTAHVDKWGNWAENWQTTWKNKRKEEKKAEQAEKQKKKK